MNRTGTFTRFFAALALLVLATARPDQGGPLALLGKQCLAADRQSSTTATPTVQSWRPPAATAQGSGSSVLPDAKTPCVEAGSRGDHPTEYAYCGGDPVNRRDPLGLGQGYIDSQALRDLYSDLREVNKRISANEGADDATLRGQREDLFKKIKEQIQKENAEHDVDVPAEPAPPGDDTMPENFPDHSHPKLEAIGKLLPFSGSDLSHERSKTGDPESHHSALRGDRTRVCEALGIGLKEGYGALAMSAIGGVDFGRNVEEAIRKEVSAAAKFEQGVLRTVTEKFEFSTKMLGTKGDTLLVGEQRWLWVDKSLRGQDYAWAMLGAHKDHWIAQAKALCLKKIEFTTTAISPEGMEVAKKAGAVVDEVAKTVTWTFEVGQ